MQYLPCCFRQIKSGCKQCFDSSYFCNSIARNVPITKKKQLMPVVSVGFLCPLIFLTHSRFSFVAKFGGLFWVGLVAGVSLKCMHTTGSFASALRKKKFGQLAKI
jgi:hypothetical protein